MPAARRDSTLRQRRTHAKSKKGCGNCKLRRVKCDETKPECKKCAAYGVSCDYAGSDRRLDLTAEGSFQVELNKPGKPSEQVLDLVKASMIRCWSLPPAKTNSTLVHASLADTQKRWDERFGTPEDTLRAPDCELNAFTKWDMEVLKRFQERTVNSVGNHQTAATYRDCICRLACTQPFLMHMVLGITLLHDANLASATPGSLSTTFESTALHHWNTATKLFNNVLCKPIPDPFRDAIWATGALLAAASFAFLEASRPEEAWPLKPPGPSDLDWLRLGEGKKAIWRIADPMRSDSVFHAIATEIQTVTKPSWILRGSTSADPSTFACIPLRFRRLFNVDVSTSTIASNPYHFPLLTLMRLEHLVLTQDNLVEFLYFMILIPQDFKHLLTEKDSRALLLVLWWYRKLESGEVWWLRRRAALEGRAVELWLERWFGGVEGLLGMYGSLSAAPDIGGAAEREVEGEADMRAVNRGPTLRGKYGEGETRAAGGGFCDQMRAKGDEVSTQEVLAWIRDKDGIGCPVQ